MLAASKNELNVYVKTLRPQRGFQEDSMKRLALLLLLLCVTLLNGCAYTGYSIYDDQRLMGTMSDDKELSAKIKTALLDESFSGGWSVAVYSFYGHVFLVGEIPDTMQGKAVTIANRYKPRSVTTHWFTPATSDSSNFVLATKLRKEGASGRTRGTAVRSCPLRRRLPPSTHGRCQWL